MDELYRKLLAQLEEGQDTVLAFITEGDGSIPRTTGAYMLVGREGRIFGTIGGGNLEYQAVLHAQELVQEKKSEYREYDLGTGEGKGLGMVCGGSLDIFIEPIVPSPTLYIFGAGHTGLATYRVARSAGSAVSIQRNTATHAATISRVPHGGPDLRRLGSVTNTRLGPESGETP